MFKQLSWGSEVRKKISYSIEIDEVLLNKDISKAYYTYEEMTVGEILKELKLENSNIGMIIVKNRIVDLDYKIKNNDVLKIYAFMSGG